MTAYILQRGLQLIPTLLVVSIIVFAIVRFIPGDPARLLAGESATPENVAAIRERWGLDRPMAEQYLTYIRRLLRADLGVSISSGGAVVDEIRPRLQLTIQLALAGVVIAIGLGILAGIVGAIRPYSIV